MSLDPADLNAQTKAQPLFQAAAGMLRAEPRSSWGPVVMIAVLIGISSRGDTRSMLLGGAAVLLCDVGRVAMMSLLGYRDARLVLVPALTTFIRQVSDAPSAWKQGVVLTLATWPLILAAWLIAASAAVSGNAQLLGSATLFLGYAVFRTLPLLPYDGGRLLNLVVFSRSRILEILFILGTSAIVGVIAVKLRQPILGAVALLTMLRASRVSAFSKAAAALRSQATAPPSLSKATDDELAMLFRAVDANNDDARRNAARNMPAQHAPSYALSMREVHERWATLAPGLGVSVLLLALYAATLIAEGFVVVTLVLAYGQAKG